MREPDDVELMLAFKQGDYNAFALLVERHQLGLIQFFYAQGGDRALAEDCTQEVWRKIFRAREDYTHRAQFKTYLLRVARNLWIDVFRSKSRTSGDYSIDGINAEKDGGRGRGIDLADPNSPSPLDDLAEREISSRVDEALERLPEAMREVFVLAEVQGLKYQEIAALLDIPIGTVKSRMFNAIRRLRDFLKKDVNA